MLLAARQGGDAPLVTSDDIHAFATTLIDVVPARRIIEDAEPVARSALNQLVDLVDESDEDATVQSAIFEWLMFGARDARGQPLVDRIAARLPRPLTTTEGAALRAMHGSHYGLFSLESFPAPDTARARDLMADAEIALYEAALAEHHQVGQTLACFVTRTRHGDDDQPALEVITGSWQLPPEVPARFVTRIRQVRDESPLADVPLPEFLTRVAILVPLLLFEHYADHGVGDPDFPPSTF
jgi:hypothetical protein